MNIETKRVIGVLLADGWHDVSDQSFEVSDEHRYSSENGIVVLEVNQACAKWMEGGGGEIYCPVSSIIAVKHW